MKIAIMLITIVSLGGVAWWHYKKQVDSIRAFYWPALFLKVFSGIALGLLYFNYYGAGDTISYWQDGKVVGQAILSDPSMGISFLWDETSVTIDDLINDKPRSLFFVKISAILSIVSGNNYWLMATLISFVSFFGAWFIFKTTIAIFPEARLASAISFLFFPSVVFWSSGLIKESIGLASVFFLSGIFLLSIMNKKIAWWQWIVGLLSLWVGWNLKYYWIAVFLPVIITTLVVAFIVKGFSVVKRLEVVIWLGLFIIILFIGTSIHPNFYPSRFLDVIVQNNEAFNSLSKPESAIHYNNLTPTMTSLLVNTPQALVGGFFRPFIWEQNNLFSLLAGIENLILLLLVASALPSIVRLFTSPNRLIGIAAITYCVILAVFLALSTPNFGTLSRYKIGFLPFLVFLLLYQNRFLLNGMNRNRFPESTNQRINLPL